MGRRSLAKERRSQIVAATIECMALYGVVGTTLERIADASGMARGHIRHFVGNRDDLLLAAARVFFFGEDAIDVIDLESAGARMIAADASLDEALNYMFGEFAEPGSDNAAAIAFADAGRTMPEIREVVLAAYTGIHGALTSILATSFPELDDTQTRRIAYGVLTIGLGNTFIIDIERSNERIEDARAAAAQLIASATTAR